MADSTSYSADPPSTPGDRTYTTAGSNTSASSSADHPSTEERKKKAHTVQWAGKFADQTTDFTTKTADNLTTGVTQLVGWTYENTKVESRGLRPMHVRVSVRVHHVAFLHPGLDSGSRATISDTKKGRLRFGKKHKKPTGPPGLLKFGKKSGSWKNPGGSKHHLKDQLKDAAKDGPWHRSQQDMSHTDPSDVAEIVNAEAFRLSRDGIIQQHYALEQALPKTPSKEKEKIQQQRQRKARFSVPQMPMHFSPTAAAASANPTQYNRSGSATESVQNNPYSSMLSPESLADLEGAARYYKECAARPKGYRRLVVSSLPQRNDVSIPAPPKSKSLIHNLSSSALPSSSLYLAPGVGGSLSFETNASANEGQANNNMPEKKKDKEHNFDNVEYRYVGPPKTGPDFFQLLRKHGAATFGRYLPELACSVPNHSYNFELIKSKKRTASTQPIVYECPHVIWGDARDKMLSRIAKEGCPLIDQRPFEYASNSNLDDARLSESLLLCGSTLWVKRAKDEDDDDKGDQLEHKNKKALVEAEYHVAKIFDGVKDGVKGGVKGVKVGTKAAVKGAHGAVDTVGKGVQVGTKAAVKGAQGAVDAVGKGVQDVKGAIPSPIKVKSSGEKEKKKSKFRKMFHSKKKKQKRKDDDDGMSVDDSLVSGQDDYSIASEQVPVPSLQLSDYNETDDGVEEENDQDEEPVKTSAKLQSSPYVLLLDDVIDIRIVSFPDKIEIAKFPISVASVMVQRSMEDRLDDPFKPSELTCNFIQEPSAPDLRWGVTLKVTVRAVQVKPSKVPRMLLSPKINEKLSAGKAELKRFKDKMKSMGKNEEEVMKEVEKREEEVNREESELERAIVAYGYEKNDDDEYGPKEIRRRQMFYCEREHESIIHKSKRRLALTEDEMQLISDASMDPTSSNKSYEKGEVKELLSLLNIHFPGIDDENDPSTLMKSTTSSLSPASESGEVTQLSDVVEPAATDVFASLSVAMAKSLDECFGEIGATKTAEVVKQQLFTASTLERKKLDAKGSKLWVSQVSKRLSSCLHEGATITKVQKVLLESVAEGDVLLDEEMKVDEDQVALSESEESPVDGAELADWCTTVASKLEECAMELEAMYSPSELDFSDNSDVDDNESIGDEYDVRPDAKNTYDDVLEGMINRKLSIESDDNASQRFVNATSVATIDEAIPKSTRISASRADELLKKMKESHFSMKKKSSRYGSRNFSEHTLREEKSDGTLKKQYIFYAMLVIIALSSVIIISSGKFFHL
mmetsp:Transcript_24238/g.48207  ORF Transcript_24238/g.48207 Transcript_24238/m.48207 type:complete len:1253 (+) Transcript_24238:231-3989(+)